MSLRRGAAVDELVAAARAGRTPAVARLLSLVESGSPQLREVARLLAPDTGRAHVVGITGSPGVGKSTTTSALVTQLRSAGRRVAVLAVDPSSPFSGGALLGDRVRMQEHATDDGVFIRSMATRGHLGGLSAAAPQALRIFDAAGFDVVLVETVGVGQSEIEIVALADTTLVLLSPGMGDGIQAAKAGILEIADVFVVNKADRDGADRVVRDLKQMQAFAAPDSGADGHQRWSVPVLRTVASSGEGIAPLSDAIADHRVWLADGGELRRRRQSRARVELEAIALAAVRQEFAALSGETDLDALAARVATGDTDPYAASDELIRAFAVGR